jgi:hypothetical protein
VRVEDRQMVPAAFRNVYQAEEESDSDGKPDWEFDDLFGGEEAVHFDYAIHEHHSCLAHRLQLALKDTFEVPTSKWAELKKVCRTILHLMPYAYLWV